MPRPRPKLGQHFLADERFCRRIVDALDLRPSDCVIEIGPGRGAITTLLAERARRVVAIEIDVRLAEKLEDRVAHEPSHRAAIEIIQSDILATDLAEICRRAHSDRCFVFGNLPYYITSPILHQLFDFRRSIRAMALMVQREVALRLTAAAGTRDYGYLSVLTQLHSEPRIVLKVPPGVFSPPPRVDSDLVTFHMREKLASWNVGELAEFRRFIKLCFAQKRKTLANNLASLYSRLQVERVLGSLGLARRLRAEQLSLDELAALFRDLRELHW